MSWEKISSAEPDLRSSAMTCIVGLKQGNELYIGGDSAGVDGWRMVLRKDSKVFKNGEFLMGFTTSFRMGQLLRWSFVPPAHPEGVSDERFMSTTFVDAVRKCFTDGGFAKKDNEVQSGGTFIIGYRKHLYVMEEDFQIGLYHDDYVAVGCGDSIALGCLYGTAGMKPQKRVETALEAAAKYSAGVRAPFVIMKQS
jgi:hypothetical protein